MNVYINIYIYIYMYVYITTRMVLGPGAGDTSLDAGYALTPQLQGVKIACQSFVAQGCSPAKVFWPRVVQADISCTQLHGS